ncbi:Transposase InsO and inactivated derivatives [Nonomuraea solani]|uniref:Transposase InsO and inactivated derivatives n=2 Tax=Nonomuraea solani TaxID=1144553 RepID=A0A1H6ESJ8_9ACTN|nr:Transposase InsO and inactivated derivatives [Nonomuraea solani]
MALVDMSVVEQRYRAVLAVLAGGSVTEVAREVGVARQTLSGWVSRYRESGLGGLVDRSRRPHSSPSQMAAEVEVLVCELRRRHPRWGPVRLAHEAGRRGADPPPSRMGVYRALVRHGLIEPGAGRRKRVYRRWQRDAPMELWQPGIVGGVLLADGREVKVVTGVDDHSRFCVIAKAVVRATGRAVCLAFTEALQAFGAPGEVLTDNGKQFTARFGHGGEVLFDRICRDNAIVHRLTQPRSPTTTGKVERFHQTMRRELLDDAGPFEDLAAFQAELDAWVEQYNTARPHQSLDMAVPADRFTPVSVVKRELLPLRLPTILAAQPDPVPAVDDVPDEAAAPEHRKSSNEGKPVARQPTRPAPWSGGAIEFDRVVPASGNLGVAGKQFWLGPARAGQVITFWADVNVIHLLVGGVRLKSLRSHLSTNDLARLFAGGGRVAGPSPLPQAENDAVVEVERTVNKYGSVSLAGRYLLAAEILGGRRVTIRIEEKTLMFLDPDTRQLLRTRPNPLIWAKCLQLRGARPAGPPPVPERSPITVQRRANAFGVIMVARQTVSLGRLHVGQVVTVHVSDTTPTIDLDEGPRTVRRTTDLPVRNVKAHRPYKVDHVS